MILIESEIKNSVMFSETFSLFDFLFVMKGALLQLLLIGPLSLIEELNLVCDLFEGLFIDAFVLWAENSPVEQIPPRGFSL